MEFLNLIKERYSCKKFDGRPIDESVLTAILEAGRLAPTAKNAQAQRVYVLTSPKALAALDSITPCRYGAPVVLAVAYDRNSVFHYPGDTRDSGAEDASIVGVHMMLAAKMWESTAAGSISLIQKNSKGLDPSGKRRPCAPS